jgi:predicted acyltransferase
MSTDPLTARHAIILAEKPRLHSIDALRGFDMFWIVGGEIMVQTWLKYSHLRAGYLEKDTSSWQMLLNKQLEHVDWAGFRFYDLIFPLFLFIIGVVIPVSLGRMKAAGASTGQMLNRIVWRVVLIFVIGLVYNSMLEFKWDELRYAGVLQRLALGYGFAALAVLYLKPRTIVILTGLILVAYYLVLLLVPAPGQAAGDITKEHSICGYVDTLILKEALGGKIFQEYYGFGDNEGLLSTFPAFATALLGALAGMWLTSDRSKRAKFLGLVWMGLVLLAFGAAWSGFFMDMSNLHQQIPVFPIIKNLWTSSFVLWAGGWSLLLLAMFFGIIDCLGWRRWSYPFAVIGANAITIYLIDHFFNLQPLAKRLFGGTARIISTWLHPITGDTGSQVLNTTMSTAILATGLVLLNWLLLWFLYRKKIFLRL